MVHVKRQPSNESQSSPLPGGSVLGIAIASAITTASGHIDRGEHAQAQRLLRDVLSMTPNEARAQHLLGVSLDRCGRPEEAETWLAKSLGALPFGWNFACYGNVLVKLGQADKALEAARRAVTMDARHAPAHVCMGNALLALGQNEPAKAAYERALQIDGGLSEAWSNRGNALLGLDRPADALISFERALQIAPHEYASLSNRALALRKLGRFEDALYAYRLALVVRPKVVELISATGDLWMELGHDEQALACFDEVLALKPDDMQACYSSCVALDRLHRYDVLLERSERLIRNDDTRALAWLAHGNALQGLRRYDEAAQAYDRAIAMDPTLRVAVANQGVALRLSERPAEALEQYESAIREGRAHPQLLCSRAHTLQQLGRYDDAVESYEAALAIEPVDADGLYGRAMAFQQLLRYDDAIPCYEHLRRAEPTRPGALQEEAFCRLITGDFVRGWPMYESRWQDADAARARRHADRPAWTGREPIGARTILLHAEQGNGDTLQFCRYARLLADMGAQVILEVPRALKPLLASLQGVKQIVAIGDPLPAFDFQCALLSVPLALQTTLQTIPADVPYLSIDRDRLRKWKAKLDAAVTSEVEKRPCIGLAWSGNATHNNDVNRSIPLDLLSPLLERGANFVSLHQEVRARDNTTLSRTSIVHFGSDLEDYSDTAALVAQLDLVISVDTSVVHLAGALNRPVWVMLPRAPDWRWLLDRNDSPWYPSVTLFRQTRPGDWPGVVDRLTQALDQWLAAGA